MSENEHWSCKSGRPAIPAADISVVHKSMPGSWHTSNVLP
jgi:hypothetical protein